MGGLERGWFILGRVCHSKDTLSILYENVRDSRVCAGHRLVSEGTHWLSKHKFGPQTVASELQDPMDLLNLEKTPGPWVVLKSGCRQPSHHQLCYLRCSLIIDKLGIILGLFQRSFPSILYEALWNSLKYERNGSLVMARVKYVLRFCNGMKLYSAAHSVVIWSENADNAMNCSVQNSACSEV